jgi:Fe-S cluster assembly iron-binding protein IscA
MITPDDEVTDTLDAHLHKRGKLHAIYVEKNSLDWLKEMELTPTRYEEDTKHQKFYFTDPNDAYYAEVKWGPNVTAFYEF